MSVAEEIAILLARKFGVDTVAVELEIPLRSLGLDSLALEELRVLIEERLEVDLEDVQLTSRNTLAQLVAVVHEKTAA